MKKIALITCKELPDLGSDDQLLSSVLEKNGWEVSNQIWDEGGVNWNRFHVLLMRSAWDYHRKYKTFCIWLKELKNLHCKVFNSPELMAWNAHKSYLLELAANKVNVLPTRLLRYSDVSDLRKVLKDLGGEEWVVKPAVSAGAYKTFRLTDESTGLERVDQNYSPGEEVIIQPFVPSIVTSGELSLVFFGGVYSHAVHKVSEGDDFRVQEEFGGKVVAIEPPLEALAKAKFALEQLYPVPLYARVDLVLYGKGYHLIELEVLEPSLFFGCHEGSAEVFSQALRARL